MKPKPFSALNHLTVPCGIAFFSHTLNGSGSMAKAGGRAAPHAGVGTTLDLTRGTAVTRSTHAVSTIEEDTTATGANATTPGRDAGRRSPARRPAPLSGLVRFVALP